MIVIDEQQDFDKVSRIVVVSDIEVVFEKYGLYEDGIEIHLQDDGRTLKILPRKENS